MKKNLKTLLAVSLASVLAFPACKKETKYEISDELFVALENPNIERFDSVELELGDGVKEVEWSSSDENIAVVENGMLIGLKAGTTVISAVLGDEKQEQTVTVIDEGKTPIIDVDYLPVMCNNSYEMDTQAYFNGAELSGASFSYSVADPSIATVENNVVKGVAYGETTVTISLSWRGQMNVATKTVPCTVTKNVAVYTDKATYTLYTMDNILGESFVKETQIQTSVYYEGEKLHDLEFSWSSGDTSIATVDDNGKVSSVAYGETYVVGTCEYNGEKLSTNQIPVKVEKPYVKTNVDLLFKVGEQSMEFDVGYKVGKVVNLATGIDYSCTDNSTNLKNLATGEYKFAVYEENEAYTAEVNVIIADHIVTDKDSLVEAVSDQDVYVALANDVDVGAFTPRSYKDTADSTRGTFNGLGHTLTITYPKKNSALYFGVNNFTFKNLGIKCTLGSSIESAALFRMAGGKVVIENCYVETTLADTTDDRCGGVGFYFSSAVTLTLRNVFVRVYDQQTDYVRQKFGAIIAVPMSSTVTYDNVYVIGNEVWLANPSDKRSGPLLMNSQTGILYKNDNAFKAARQDGEVVLSGFNHYWDLGDENEVPEFKAFRGRE